MERRKVEQFLKRFGAKNQCRLKLKNYLDYGLMGLVFEVTEQPGLLQAAKYAQYAECGLVMKIMQSDVAYEKVCIDGDWIKVSTKELGPKDREDHEKYHRQEIELMEQFRDCEYIMPLLDSEIICESRGGHNRYTFMMLMPKLTPLKEELCEMLSIQERQLIVIGKHISQALDVCHRAKVLHRDIKSANVYVMKNTSEGVRYVLGDFGCCRSFERDPNGDLTRIRNAETDDPAVEYGAIKPGSYVWDVYQLGRMLQLIAEDLNRVGISLGRHFQEILNKATQVQPDKRYPDGGAMLRALLALPSVEKRSTTKIEINQPLIRMKRAVEKGAYDEALELAQDDVPGCSVLGLYCRSHLALQSLREGRGHVSEIRRLMEEAEEKALEEKSEKYAAACFCLAAMLARTIGHERFEMNLLRSAEDGFVPAMYYCGVFADRGELSCREKGMEYLRLAAKEGCEEAFAFYLDRSPQTWPPELVNTIRQMDYADKLCKRRENLFLRCL